MEEDACHTVNAQNVISKMRIHKGPRVEVIKSALFILKLKSRFLRFLPSPKHAFLPTFFFFFFCIKLCDRMIDLTGKPEMKKMLTGGCLCINGRSEKKCLEKLGVLFAQ